MSHPHEDISVGAVNNKKQLMSLGGDHVAELQTIIDLPATPEQMLYKFVTNSTGSIDFTFTTSGTLIAPVEYSYTCPAENIAMIRRVNISGTDGGITPLDFLGQGALTNGITIEAISTGSTQMIDFTDGHDILRNADWGFLAGVDVAYNIVGGDDQLTVRWTLAKAGAMLFLTAGQSIVFGLRDDISGAEDMNIMVQGLLLEAME